MDATLVLVILIVVILAMLGVAYVRKKSGKRKMANAADDVTVSVKSEHEIRYLFDLIGLQVIERGLNNSYIVGFQGGNFLFRYRSETDEADLYYPRFETVPYGQFMLASFVANRMNVRYSGWTCYLTFDADSPNEKPATVALSYRASLMGDPRLVAKQLGNVMRKAFHIARDFSEELAKEEKEHDDFAQTFLNNDFNNRIALVRNQLEIGHGELKEEPQLDEHTLCIAVLLSLYEDVDWGEVKQMRVLVGNRCELLTKADEIKAFDIQAYIKQHHQEVDLSELILCLNFEHGGLLIDLTRANGCTEKVLYYRMTLDRVGDVFDQDTLNPDAYTKRSLVEISLTSDREDYWEAKYMIDDAFDKQEGNKYSELSDQQKAVLAYADASIQKDLYWGQKFYNARCYYQALYYFRRIYAYHSRQWSQLSAVQKDNYYQISFYLGFVYMELGLKEKAYYFLNNARKSDSIVCAEEFVNCLCNLNDPFAIDHIQKYLTYVSEMLEDDADENLILFFRFLNRRLAYILINLHRFDEAEQLLNRMIEEGEDVDFARSELDYLNEIRDEDRD